MLDPLSRAAVRCGSDKFGAHQYTTFYNEIFNNIREKSINILEIGVGGYQEAMGGGSSLRMWAEYFPYATIVGLDYFAKELSISPRVTIVQGSQDDTVLLNRILEDYGPFDIVIDDGSHLVSHVETTFRHLYPLLPNDAIYIVEDTQTAFVPRLGGSPTGAASIFEIATRIALAMHVLEGYQPPITDDIVDFGSITASVTFSRNAIAFKRGVNTYPSNFGFSFEAPEVQKIYEIITIESKLNPSPRSNLSRIDMNIWGRRFDDAEALAIEAANAAPNDIELLAELGRMMNWAGRIETAKLMQSKIKRALDQLNAF
jgi:hypothetical protein